ncbi:MAG: hypothetical protein HQ515_16825 [Phycisphaeraceae bacterium]|nr:hypothetical protein [Phycisphaeraceae bacterium]
MNRLRFLLGSIVAWLALTGPTQGAAPLLRDGLYAKSVLGRVEAVSETGPWFLQLHSEIKDQNMVVPKGTRMELLPCGMLEILLDDPKVKPETDVRIWAKVAQYRGKNYFFMMNYFGLSAPVKTLPQKQIAEDGSPVKVDRLQIPDALKKRMAQQRVVHTAAMPKVATILTNKILINRFGYVKSHKEQKVFVFDGLGYSAGHAPVQVLPCEALERIETLQDSGVGPYRFSIAGMTTTFRGQQYIYLQRAMRVFNHGNFGQ